jgi:hypothetical protein
MRIIAISKLKSGATKEKAAALFAKEMAAEWALQKADVIRQTHSRADQPGTILMLEAQSTAEAKQKLAALPLVAEGVMEFDLYPYQAYEAYEGLFGKVA